MSFLKKFLNILTPITPSQGSRAYNIFTLGSGASVETADAAMRHTTVYACVQAIADALASVTLNTFQKKDGVRKTATNHPLYQILKFTPNNYLTRVDFIKMFVQDILLRGNHYSQILRNGRGEVVGIYPLIADNMTIYIRKNKNIVYVYQTANKKYNLKPEEVLHIKGLPDATGLVGLNPIEYNRKSIEISKTTEQFGLNFFKNGANGSGILKHPKVLSDDAYNRLKEEFENSYGGLENSGKPIILEDGLTYERLSLSNEDSQFLETRRYQKADIASLFKVPLYMLGDMSKTTFSNMEQMSINFVQNTLLPHAVNFELAAFQKLLTKDEQNSGYYIKFNLNSLMRGDFKTRTEGYRTLINIGSITPNEVRELEDFNPAGDEADKLYMQINMGTLENISKGNTNANQD